MMDGHASPPAGVVDQGADRAHQMFGRIHGQKNDRHDEQHFGHFFFSKVGRRPFGRAKVAVGARNGFGRPVTGRQTAPPERIIVKVCRRTKAVVTWKSSEIYFERKTTKTERTKGTQ